MDSELLNFLKSFINRDENIDSLLRIYMRKSRSKICALFIKEFTKYVCISQIDDYDNKKPLLKIEILSNIDNIIIGDNNNENILIGDNIINYMILPIITNNESIGCICMVNSDTNYSENILSEISCIISVTQLILSKHKIILEYKKMYSTTDNFSKDLFLANMSHEIRTPLNGIIGYNQLLFKTKLDLIQQNYLKSMNQCSLQLLSIINDIIDFSKLTTGHMQINNECFEVQEISYIIESIIGKKLEEKKQKLKYNISPKLPRYIISDKGKIVQILINLISNSIKFSPENSEIYVVMEISDYQKIMIKVIDRGVGISEQEQCKLFNAFIQIQNSVSKTGSGLGLAIAKRLVELLHGDINLESKHGTGTMFYFTFKYKLCIEAEKKIEYNNSEIFSNKYILVVDDNVDNRIIINDILLEWKMYPIICASAKEAFKMVISDRYDFSLALLDIRMPETGGVELSTQIKNEKPYLPLIALSSIDSYINLDNFESRIDKPINKLQLHDSIYNVLKKSKYQNFYIGNNDINIDHTSITVNTYNKNIKILITEDIDYNRTLLINMLNLIGYNDIECAIDGFDAIEHIKKSIYDLIILDLRMPNLDGFGVLEYLQKTFKDKMPKIIVITASIVVEDKDRCRKYGVEYFLNKPIMFSDLKKVMLCVSKN